VKLTFSANKTNRSFVATPTVAVASGAAAANQDRFFLDKGQSR
jgi:hypothetical protein